jgi:hypothetical protein
MPPEAIAERDPLATWRVESLRLTAFPSPSAQIIEPTWWHDLGGEEPESRVSQPRKGGLKEQGSFAGGSLILGVEPTRIDWVYTPIIDEKQASEGILTIGPLQNTIGVFTSLMNRWFNLETCPTVLRLAFGAVTLQPAQDLRSGYRQLAHYLHSVQIDIENSSDFIYQINRKRHSGIIHGLDINRLMRWSVAAQQYVSMQMVVPPESMQMPSVPTRGSVGPRYYACRLEMDINTVPEFQGSFEREQLTAIFQELVDLALEIFDHGDIP